MRSNTVFKRYEPYPKCVPNPTKVVPSSSKTISNSEITIVKIGSQGISSKNINKNNKENKENIQKQSVLKVDGWVLESSNEIANKPDEKKCSKYDKKREIYRMNLFKELHALKNSYKENKNIINDWREYNPQYFETFPHFITCDFEKLVNDKQFKISHLMHFKTDLGIGCNFDENERTNFLVYDHQTGLFLQDERLNNKNQTTEEKISLVKEIKKNLDEIEVERYRSVSFNKMQEMLFPTKEDLNDDDENRSFVSEGTIVDCETDKNIYSYFINNKLKLDMFQWRSGLHHPIQILKINLMVNGHYNG